MASTFTNLNYHVVYSTKYRRKLITKDIQEELYKIIGGVVRNNDGKLLEIGGVEDHVHLLIGIPAKMAVSDMLRLIKTNSAKWVNEQSQTKTKFQWQTGYAAFSVSFSNCDSVRRYIRQQESHHKTESFEEEFLAILERHGVEYDPRYVFETEHVG